MRLNLGFGGLVLGLVTAASAFAQMGASYRLVAFTGETAPGGSAYGELGDPAIGDDGTVAFFETSGRLLKGGTRVFAERLGVPRVVATAGGTVPAGNATFEQFTSVSVGADGQTAFNAQVRQPTAEFSQSAVAIEGGAIFGVNDPLGFFSFGPASFRAGQELYVKGERSIGVEATETLAAGLSSKGAKSVVSVGDKLAGPGGSFLYVASVYENLSQTLDPFAGVGNQIDSSEDGQVALKVTTSPSPSNTPTPRQTIYAGKPGSLRYVARTGDAAPQLPNYALGDLSPAPSIARPDRVAFAATLTFQGCATQSPGITPSAVFGGPIGALTPLVRAGDPVPTTANVTFSNVALGAVTNETGDVVFKARILYPNGGVRTGFWVKRKDGEPVLLAVDGMSLPTPGGSRVADSVDFAGPGTFNQLHQFVFRARFWNGEGYDDGIYIADTRPLIPWVRVSYPRQARDRVTTASSITIRGVAIDETGIDKVTYTVETPKKRGRKAPAARRLVPRLAKGDRKWEFTVPLTLGINRIAVTATDKIGNVSEPLFLAILRY